jgi:hypothetical protein
MTGPPKSEDLKFILLKKDIASLILDFTGDVRERNQALQTELSRQIGELESCLRDARRCFPRPPAASIAPRHEDGTAG